MRLTWFSSFETPSAFLLVFGVLVNKEGTEGLVGPSWMGFLGHPWFLSHAPPAPILPCQGWGTAVFWGGAQPLCLPRSPGWQCMGT